MAQPTQAYRPRDLQQFQDELSATLAARRELGPEAEDTLTRSFLQQLERTIDARVDARVAEATRRQAGRNRGRTAVIAASLALAIPLMGAAGAFAGSIGVFLVVGMVVLVNLIDFVKV